MQLQGRAVLHKLRFSLKDKDWSHTTDPIHPNKTSAYTYTGYTLPLAVAEKITASNHATMTVELVTYSDSECTSVIGDAGRKDFTVTVPSNVDTQPAVTMTLTPLNALDGFYLKGLSKVQAQITAEPKYGTQIEEYKLNAQYQSAGYSGDGTEPLVTEPLNVTGAVEITGSAADSRGITGQAVETVTVYPYFTPKLTGVKAYRCRSDGTAADDGTCLRIEATREYAPVMVGDEQKNFCQIQFRYKRENETDYSEPETILEATATEDSVDAVLTKPLAAEHAWSVQIIAKDTVGQSTVVTIAIPSERVFMHKKAGGKGLGLGGMCQEDDLLDVHWNQRVRKDLQVDGSICGAYIRVAESKPDLNTLVLETAFEYAVGDKIQSIFALGSGWSDTWIISNVRGVVMSADGSGIGQLTNDEGGKTYLINLINNRENPMILISADPFEIIE